MIVIKAFILIISLTIPTLAQTPSIVPTNAEVQFHADLSNIQFGKSFSVNYTMPAYVRQIISVDSNIVVEGDTDIEITNITPTSLDLRVTSYAVQSYPMPSLLLTVLSTNQQTNQFYTPSFIIPITNDIISNTNITLADIEPIYFVWDPLWTILIGIFFLILFVIFMIQRYRKPYIKPEPVVVIDPFDQARKKLNQLKAQSLELNDENYKEFFVELSETVREFMGLTIFPFSLELPTSELLSALKKQNVNQDLLEGIGFILKNTDRAKYAKQVFPQERVNEVLAESFRLLKTIKNQEGDQNEL